MLMYVLCIVYCVLGLGLGRESFYTKDMAAESLGMIRPVPACLLPACLAGRINLLQILLPLTAGLQCDENGYLDLDRLTFSSKSLSLSSTPAAVGWIGAKGAREIFLSFFLLWPKKYFCRFTRFRQF
jgi:hypothetical protein